MKENTRGKEPMQGVVNTQAISEVEEHSDPSQGGAKRSHESSNSDKEQPTQELIHNINVECQLTLVGHANTRWIQVKPKKGKKG